MNTKRVVWLLERPFLARQHFVYFIFRYILYFLETPSVGQAGKNEVSLPVTRPHHSGSYETGLFILLFALVLGAIASITSLIINFALLKKQLRRKI
jgi:hypothetical protein